eukprot:NODE_28_length_38599_cov_0.791792.p3 type:complete len:762 gc:universal NODE_28_length_38599_cov_0.791792:25142-27427(+)
MERLRHLVPPGFGEILLLNMSTNTISDLYEEWVSALEMNQDLSSPKKRSFINSMQKFLQYIDPSQLKEIFNMENVRTMILNFLREANHYGNKKLPLEGFFSFCTFADIPQIEREEINEEPHIITHSRLRSGSKTPSTLVDNDYSSYSSKIEDSGTVVNETNSECEMAKDVIYATIREISDSTLQIRYKKRYSSFLISFIEFVGDAPIGDILNLSMDFLNKNEGDKFCATAIRKVLKKLNLNLPKMESVKLDDEDTEILQDLPELSDLERRSVASFCTQIIEEMSNHLPSEEISNFAAFCISNNYPISRLDQAFETFGPTMTNLLAKIAVHGSIDYHFKRPSVAVVCKSVLLDLSNCRKKLQYSLKKRCGIFYETCYQYNLSSEDMDGAIDFVLDSLSSKKEKQSMANFGKKLKMYYENIIEQMNSPSESQAENITRPFSDINELCSLAIDSLPNNSDGNYTNEILEFKKFFNDYNYTNDEIELALSDHTQDFINENNIAFLSVWKAAGYSDIDEFIQIDNAEDAVAVEEPEIIQQEAPTQPETPLIEVIKSLPLEPIEKPILLQNQIDNQPEPVNVEIHKSIVETFEELPNQKQDETNLVDKIKLQETNQNTINVNEVSQNELKLFDLYLEKYICHLKSQDIEEIVINDHKAAASNFINFCSAKKYTRQEEIKQALKEYFHLNKNRPQDLKILKDICNYSGYSWREIGIEPIPKTKSIIESLNENLAPKADTRPLIIGRTSRVSSEDEAEKETKLQPDAFI